MSKSKEKNYVDNMSEQIVVQSAGEPYLHVALVGECNCGKSTFLNNIIGERLLATDLLVTTAIPTYIKWDSSGKVEVVILEENGLEYRLDQTGKQKLERDFHISLPEKPEEMLDFITTNNELCGKIKKVQVNFPRQKRYSSICMIDTPGINPGQKGTEQHVLETQTVIMEAADMVVILFPATKVMGKSFTDFLEKYSPHLMKDAVFVITQMDMIPNRMEREKIIRFVENRLQKTFELSEPLVYGSSAELALRYKGDTGSYEEEEKIWSDRFDSMWDEILERFNARKIKMLFEDMNMKTQQKLDMMSLLTSKDAVDYQACWDMEAEKIARIISKVEKMSSAMKMPGVTSALKEDLQGLVEQCRSAEFQIAIVGVMKAGKSMLMNALMGAEIASVDINPETASLTKFRSSSSGYYVKVKFHSRREWNKLCASAQESSGGGILHRLVKSPAVEQLSEKWVDHKEITMFGSSVEDVRREVAHWTSARSNDHLFASEVEVGIDKSVFNMPDEVVFVDTPGLHDPVQYRSDITKEYIRRANAVLIAVSTGALTAEGLGTITTVLDYVGSNKEKAYIVATKKDTLSSRDCEKVMKGWVEHLVSAKRYADNREASAHIIVTSAYMHLQLQKFLALEEEDLNVEEKFSDLEYAELESYAKKNLKGKDRRYRVESLRETEEDVKALEADTGILRLQRCLERSLIAKYRDLKRKDIQEEYLRCRKELLTVSDELVINYNTILESARKGAGELRKRLNESSKAYEEAKEKNQQIRKAVEDVKQISASMINCL